MPARFEAKLCSGWWFQPFPKSKSTGKLSFPKQVEFLNSGYLQTTIQECFLLRPKEVSQNQDPPSSHESACFSTKRQGHWRGTTLQTIHLGWLQKRPTALRSSFGSTILPYYGLLGFSKGSSQWVCSRWGVPIPEGILVFLRKRYSRSAGCRQAFR